MRWRLESLFDKRYGTRDRIVRIHGYAPGAVPDPGWKCRSSSDVIRLMTSTVAFQSAFWNSSNHESVIKEWTTKCRWRRVVGAEDSKWPKHKKVRRGESDGDRQHLGVTTAGGGGSMPYRRTFRRKEDSIQQDFIGNPECTTVLAADRRFTWWFTKFQ